MKSDYKIKKINDHLEITISNGFTTKIDESSAWILKVFPSWQKKKGYVCCERWIKTKYGSVLQRIYLHKLITGPTKKWQVDHANRDKSDNRKENLRMATPSQNSANSVRATRSKSGFRGVTLEKRNLTKKYICHIAGKSLGRFKTATEAAKAYDKEAKNKYGCFAVLNFP